MVVCILSSGSPDAAIKVSAGAGVSPEAQDPLLSSRVLGRIHSSWLPLAAALSSSRPPWAVHSVDVCFLAG